MPEDEVHEKWRADPLGGVFFGLFLIVVAGIYLFRDQLPKEPWWAWIIIGIGCIFLLETVVRSVIPQYKRPSLGRALWGVIFIAIGLGFAYEFQDLWPALIIVVGVIVLIYYIRQSM